MIMFKAIDKFLDRFVRWRKNKELLKWLYDITKSFKRYMLGFLLINLLSLGISLVSSYSAQYIVDAATGYRSGLFFKYIVIMLTTTVLSLVVSALGSMFSSYVNERFAFGIRAKMYDRIQRSVWFKVSKLRTGDVLSRLSADVDSVASTIITIIPNTVVTICKLLVFLCILLYNDPVLAVIGLIVAPTGMFVTVFFRRRHIKLQRALRESHSEYYSFIQESMSNITVVKTFQLEDKNIADFQKIRDKRMKLVVKSTVLMNIMSSLSTIIYSVGYVITFSWCAYNLTMAAQGSSDYTYGTMTLFLSLVGQLQGSIRSFGGIIPKIMSLLVNARRVYDITELEREDYTPIETMPKTVGLKAENVVFGYEDDTVNVINDLNFEIPPLCRVGIVGTSGVGKTTFIRMLLALLKPTRGNLAYIDENGNPEKPCPASRRFISYVPQGNTLQPGTVRSNLLTGNPNISEDQMWEVLDIVDAAEFLKKSPKGLDTILADDARGLSEGQAQRISIARALLRNKPILILDEATSALDEATEAKIFKRICETQKKTCFIITHRRSMLKYCDLVLEIGDDGVSTLTKGTAE